MECGLTSSLPEKLLGLADVFSGGLRIMFVLALGEAIILFLFLSTVTIGTSGTSSGWDKIGVVPAPASRRASKSDVGAVGR